MKTFYLLTYFIFNGKSPKEIVDFARRYSIDIMLLQHPPDERMLQTCGIAYRGDYTTELINRMHQAGKQVYADGGRFYGVLDGMAEVRQRTQRLEKEYPFLDREGKPQGVCLNRPEVRESVAEGWASVFRKYAFDGLFHEDDFAVTPCCCEFCKTDFERFCRENGLPHGDPTAITTEKNPTESLSWLRYKHFCAQRYSRQLVEKVKSVRPVPIGVWLNENEWRERRGLNLSDAAEVFDLVGIMSYYQGWRWNLYGTLCGRAATEKSGKVFMVLDDYHPMASCYGGSLLAGADAVGVFPFFPGYWSRQFDPSSLDKDWRAMGEVFSKAEAIWMEGWRRGLVQLVRVGVCDYEGSWGQDSSVLLLGALGEGVELDLVDWRAPWHPLEINRLSAERLRTRDAWVIPAGYGAKVGFDAEDLKALQDYLHAGGGALLEAGALKGRKGQDIPAEVKAALGDCVSSEAEASTVKVLGAMLPHGGIMGTVEPRDGWELVAQSASGALLCRGTASLGGRLAVWGGTGGSTKPLDAGAVLGRLLRWVTGTDQIEITGRSVSLTPQGPGVEKGTASFVLTNKGSNTIARTIWVAIPHGARDIKVLVEGKAVPLHGKRRSGSLAYLAVPVRLPEQRVVTVRVSFTDSSG